VLINILLKSFKSCHKSSWKLGMFLAGNRSVLFLKKSLLYLKYFGCNF